VAVREDRPMRTEPFDAARDDVSAITALLHAAYGGYAAHGFRYTAATQDDARTAARLTAGVAFVARNDDGALVGTVTYYGAPSPSEAASIAWYRRLDVGNFGQFAVAPELQRGGVGTALLDAVERRAREDGKSQLACETNAANAPLVAYYVRRGFREVARFVWPGDDATCVLSKKLR
jgi:GNAT superfamily N-acetyltransferase